MESASDSVAVVAAVRRDDLSYALSGIHGQGFGHVTRVFDPSRGDPIVLMRRAGVNVPNVFRLDASVEVAVVVAAPGRIERAAALLDAHGARLVLAVPRAVLTNPLGSTIITERAGHASLAQ